MILFADILQLTTKLGWFVNLIIIRKYSMFSSLTRKKWGKPAVLSKQARDVDPMLG